MPSGAKGSGMWDTPFQFLGPGNRSPDLPTCPRFGNQELDMQLEGRAARTSSLHRRGWQGATLLLHNNYNTLQHFVECSIDSSGEGCRFKTFFFWVDLPSLSTFVC
jgi:hypothetical protein